MCRQRRPEDVDSAKCALIWMHGLGDTEKGWSQMIRQDVRIENTCGPCHMEFPRAPLVSVSCNGVVPMTSWFDMRKLPLGADDDVTQLNSLDDAKRNAATIHRYVDKFIAAGIPGNKIFIGGFSQGGAMALVSSMTYRERLAGCIVFSGVVLGADELETLTHEQNRGLSVLWCHGFEDPILEPSLQKTGVDVLNKAGFLVEKHTFHMAHQAHPEEFKVMTKFMNARLH